MQANQMPRAAPVLCLFTFVFSTSAWADRPAQPEVLTNPEVNEPLQADVSAPLRDMATPPRADAPRRIIPIGRPELQQMMNAAAMRSQAASGDGALQTAILPTVLAVPGVNVLGVGNGLDPAQRLLPTINNFNFSDGLYVGATVCDRNGLLA